MSEDIKSAFIDVLAGNQKWYNLQAQTGLSEKRCKEIESLFYKVLDEHKHKRGLSS